MQDRETMDLNKIDVVKPTLSNCAQGCKTTAHNVSMMHHIPQQPHQTGQVKTGMVRKLRPGSNAPSLTLIC